MTGISPRRLVGREKELALLQGRLEDIRAGSGSTVVISGETGIGKSRILDELAEFGKSRDFTVLRGACISDSNSPLLPFGEALGGAGLGSLLISGPNPKLECLYLMSRQGLLLGKVERAASSLDADVFTSMLRAVEEFVKDSLKVFSGEQSDGSLNSMGYGGYTILLQKGHDCTLAAIITGTGNEFLVEDIDQTLGKINEKFGEKLKSWKGVLADVDGIELPLRELLSSGKYEGVDFARGDPGLRQSQMLENITRGLLREGRKKPLCVVIEDLQWADSSSLTLFHYLSRNTRPGPVLLIGTFRPEDLQPGADLTPHPLSGLLSALSAENLLLRMELCRLNPENITRMVESLLEPCALLPEFFIRIAKETDGNPMYITELLRLLAQEGALYEESGVWKSNDTVLVAVPSKVSEVVTMRLSRLSQEQRDVIDCAAVEGQEFNSSVVAHALELNTLKLLKILKELESAHHLLRPRQDGYVFDQTKVREVLVSQLSSDLRKEYNRLIAKALEKVYDGRQDDVTDELAHHYFEAGDTDHSLPLLVKSGDRAREKFSNGEAVDSYTKALGLMGDSPQWAGDSVTINESTGDLLALMGRYDRSIESFRNALAVLSAGKLGKGKRATEMTARITRRIGEVLEKKGDFDRADAELDGAIKLLEKSPMAEKGRSLLDKGILRWKRSDYDGAEKMCEDALVEFEREKDDPKDIAKAHNILGLIHQSRGDYDGALGHFGKSLEVDEQTGDLRTAITTQNNIGVAYWNKDEYDRALKIFEINLKTIEKIGDQQALANTYNNLGLIHWNRGLNAQARPWHEKSLAIRQRIGDRPGVAASLNNLGLVSWGLGDFDRALELFRDCLGKREKLGDRAGVAVCNNNIGNILADRCRFEEARGYYEKSLTAMEELGDRQGIAIALNNLGDVSSRLGKADMAFQYYTKSLGLLEKIGDVQGMAIAYNNLGNLYIEKEEYPRAEEYFENSRRIREKIGDDKGLGVALNNLGDLWFYRGDNDKAEKLYNDSIALCEKMDNKGALVESLCGLAEVLLRKGNLDGAFASANRANEISKSLGLREDEGWSLRIMGKVYGKQGKWLKCVEFLEDGVRLYREIGLEAGEGDALMEIGNAYSEKGEQEKARECLKKAAEIFERRGQTTKFDRARLSLEKYGGAGPSSEQ